MLALAKYYSLYVVYFAAFIFMLAALTGKTKYALFLLVFFLPLQNLYNRLEALPFGKDLNDALLIAILIGWVIFKISNGQGLFEKTTFNFVILLYVIYSYFTLWYGTNNFGFPTSINPSDPRVQMWKNYMIMPLLFLITMNTVQSKKEQITLVFVMCVTMLIMDYYNVIQISWMGSWFSREKLNGTFVWLSINSTAAFYATYTFVLIGLFEFVKDLRIKLLLGIIIALNLYCVLFTYSRGAYAAVIIGLFVFSMIKNKKLLIPLVIALLFWSAILPKEAIKRIEYTDQAEGQLDTSAASRIELWEQSIEYFKQSPIVGMGFNTFNYIGTGMDTHNIFLRTLAEQGLIGIGLLLSIFLLSLKRSWHLYRSSGDNFFKGLGLGCISCVIAMFVANIFGDRWTFLQVGSYFWIFMGMVERGNLIAEAEK